MLQTTSPTAFSALQQKVGLWFLHYLLRCCCMVLSALLGSFITVSELGVATKLWVGLGILPTSFGGLVSGMPER